MNKGCAVMKKKEYYIKDVDVYITVWESRTQKEILEVLDELLENEKEWLAGANLDNPFEDEAFHILYNDGTTYDKLDGIEDGVYKKKNIRAIVYDNPCDTWVYGDYEVNEYGVVTYKE